MYRFLPNKRLTMNFGYTLGVDFKENNSGDDVEVAEEYRHSGCILNQRYLKSQTWRRLQSRSI